MNLGPVELARRRLGDGFAGVAGRLRGRTPPSWLLGLLVAVLAWEPSFGSPYVGLDGSWRAGLQMAADRGLDFGTDVVFTYGPLGFLRDSTVWHGDLAVLAFLYSSGLYLALCVSLVWALRPALGPVAAALVAFLAIAVTTSVEAPLIVALVWCLAALSRTPQRYAVWGIVVGGASLAAAESLIRLSSGPIIFAVCLVALIGARARWWQAGAFVVLYAVELALLWLITGQSLVDFADYVANGREIVSGYSEAMAVKLAPGWQQPLALVALFATVVAAAFGAYRDSLARWSAVVAVALAGFLLFKQGFVRYEASHVAFYFSTICVVWLVLWWPRARQALLLGGAAALAALMIHATPSFPARLDVIGNVRLAGNQVRTLLSPSRRADLIELGRQSLKSVYRLDPRTLAGLRGHSVHIDPWEIGVAWAYDLNWSPLPVFQSYSAYTEELDRLNAEEVQSAPGPERILRENPALVDAQYPTRTIDGRFPAWDPPRLARAILCHFVPLHTTSRWQVLARAADRCGAPELIRSVDASFGAPVEVPAPGDGEVVFARIGGVEVDGLERLRTFLLRTPARYAVLNGATTYRLVPGTASDGLLLRGPEGLSRGGPFAQIPAARTIELTGIDGDLRFDFFRMTLRPATAGGVR